MNQNNIRNFAIIAHVDHGKSTLADRFLELTHTISKDKIREQFLDQNPISRERGITIKLAPVRMNYTLHAIPYTFNLIDTPGHVDFSYEVSRTLAACEGAILLIDATQGIQAQTVAHFYAAKKEQLTLIPVVNKIDLPNAQTEAVIKELIDTFGFSKDEILYISAKTGQNVQSLLESVIQKIPSPRGKKDAALRALVFDAVFDEHRGVIAYVRLIDGQVSVGDTVEFFQNGVKAAVNELGHFSPYLVRQDKLTAGEIGYIITGIKDIKKVRVGDTITSSKFLPRFGQADEAGKVQNEKFEPLPGYKIPKPMVFFGIYPKVADDFVRLRDALGKLTLNDTSLTYSEEYSSYLGSGFQVGFLGLLHAEIVKERLQREFHLNLFLTMPQVLYEKAKDGQLTEPYMLLTVYTPTAYVGGVMHVCQKKKGHMHDVVYHDTYAVLSYEMPYSMFIRGLSSEIKSISSGFASIDYSLTDYKPADLVKLDILLNGNAVDVLSELVYKDEALYIARRKVEKLKESLPRQQFRQIIQGLVDDTIVAREEIPPFRKDVLQKMSGGDRTRKDKLLEAQKKGKAKMLTSAKVVLPQEALFSMLEGK